MATYQSVSDHCSQDSQRRYATAPPLERFRRFVEQIVAQSGPEPSDYARLDEHMRLVHEESERNRPRESDMVRLREAFGDALSPATMQGFAFLKPHGYAGDFEIIDRIYQRHTAQEKHLAAWDNYYHSQPAPNAVRNRKSYFHAVLERHAQRCRPLRVLNVASGPCRCVFEWVLAHPSSEVLFRCIELDANAIAYARRLNAVFLDRVHFTQMNVLRFRASSERYDVIWAAGIFDYFRDAVFQSVLHRLAQALAPGGELIIGNFSKSNPSRPYMELVGNWHLHHRSPEDLATRAIEAGIGPENMSIGVEPEGVNLFLHICRGITSAETRASGSPTTTGSLRSAAD